MDEGALELLEQSKYHLNLFRKDVDIKLQIRAEKALLILNKLIFDVRKEINK